MSKRDELLKLLFDVADDIGGDREQSHVEAENLLLDLLGDSEVIQAWFEARDHWWYA